MEDILKAKTKSMKNTLTIFLICIVSFATTQTKKLTKEDIFKEGTVIKYVIGETYKINSFSGNRFGESEEELDTVTYKIVMIDKKLHVIPSNNKEKAFELLKDQSPDYFQFEPYIKKTNYVDLLLPKDMVHQSSITVYNFEAKKPIQSHRFKYPDSFFRFSYNGEEKGVSTSIYKSEPMNKSKEYLVQFFNKDGDFPITTKGYIIMDTQDFGGLYYKLISIETKE